MVGSFRFVLSQGRMYPPLCAIHTNLIVGDRFAILLLVLDGGVLFGLLCIRHDGGLISDVGASSGFRSSLREYAVLACASNPMTGCAILCQSTQYDVADDVGNAIMGANGAFRPSEVMR